MMNNRSIPRSVIIPELAYRDVREAVEWLCRVFGLTERLQIADHRAQLTFGDGAMVVRDGGGQGEAAADHSIMVRVDDVDAHCRKAREGGARIVREPADYPFGERQYTAQDLGGHFWTFTQSIADVHPRDWGGMLFEP